MDALTCAGRVVLQLDDVLAERRKQLKASQKTALDALQQQHDVNIENTKQRCRAEVLQQCVSQICIMKSV